MDRNALLWKASLAVIGEFGVMHRLSDTKGFSETEVPLWRPLGSSSANLLLCDTHNRSQGSWLAQRFETRRSA
jgi:hypothetical protein